MLGPAPRMYELSLQRLLGGALDRIKQTFVDPILDGDAALTVTARIGVALAERNDDAQAAVTRADGALFARD